MKRTLTCPKCGGSGKIGRNVCHRCEGTGTVVINDNGEWELCYSPMHGDLHFKLKDTSITMYFTGDVLSVKSEKWAKKVYFTLSVWSHVLLNSKKAWDKMVNLKSTKSGKEMAEIINTGYDKAKSCPATRDNYYWHNKDTNECIWCDKDGNSLT